MESIEEMLHNIAVSVQNLSETQQFVIIGVLAVLGIIWIVRKSPKDAYDIGKDGSKRRPGGSARRLTTRRKEFYTTPGTYEIREARPHKFTPREKPREQSTKSWDKDIDDWVKKRKTKRR